MHVSVRSGVATLAAGLALAVVPVAAVGADAATTYATSMSVRSNHRIVTAGSYIVVAAHLNVTGAPVTFTRAYRGHAAAVVYRGTTDSKGNVAMRIGVAYTATYTASFAGGKDTQGNTLLPSHNSTGVYARVKMAIAAAGGSKKHGYRLYKASKKAKVATATGPSKAGRKVLFRLQVLKGRKYRTVDTRRYKLNKRGAVAVTYRGKAGHRYRVRAEYRGDSANAANHTKWVYSRFH